MRTKIQSKGFTAKQELEDFIKEKAEKLFRLYEKTLCCEVVLKIDKSETRDNKHCDIRMVIAGNDLLAGARCTTFEEATIQAIEALERQIHRKKTRILQRGNKKAN
jgi:putative sigma-54 modulation protein